MSGLVACGPYLDPQLRDRHAFTSPAKCAQGPFEWHVKTIGHRWGEKVVLLSVGTSDLVGHAQIFLDGRLVSETAVGTLTVYDPATQTTKTRDPHDPRCSLSQADRATTPAAPAGPTTPATASTTPPGASTGATSTAVAEPVKLVEVPIDAQTPYGTLLAEWGVAVESWAAKPSVPKPGLDVKILFWTDNLVDLESVKLIVEQRVMVPSCGDDKWSAKLDADQAETDKKAAIDKAEADKKEAIRKQEYDRCYALASKSATDGKCRDEGWRDVSDSQRCRDLAEKDAVDDACRKDGYENKSVLAERARCSDLSKRRAVDAPCVALGYSNAPDPSAPSAAPAPMTPPPAAIAEEQPPKPSDHADWIPGSWEWSGREWSWVAGGWKVPDQDRVAKATPKAPAPPPPQQTEAIAGAPPVAGLVWIAGYWHYAGGRWVWIAGRWARPPQAGATWRPHTWVRDGAGVRLDPGQWILRK